MTTFTIKNSNSVFTAVNAFAADSAGADTLLVDQTGFLVTTGALAYGARLDATKAWHVTVNGVITSTQFCGLGLIENNTASSVITVGSEGEIFGSALSSGVFLGSAATLTNSGAITGGVGISVFGAGAHTITNKGQITGTAVSPFAIQDSSGLSNDSVTNSGTIVGDVDLGGGNNKLVNSGHMENFLAGNGDDTVTNSGVMDAVTLGNGANTLTNSSTVFGSILGGTGADKVTNSKEILGNVSLDGGVNTLSNNKGIVTGNVTATAGSANTIVNSGKINGSISLDNGNDKITNSGTVGAVDLDGGVNSLSNNKGTVSGDVTTATGSANTIVNSGAISGSILLHDGNDKVTNSGTVVDVDLDGGVNTFSNNKGTVSGDVIAAAGSVNTIVNSGTISGSILLDDGNDKVTNTGTVGTVDLDDGVNSFSNSGTVTVLIGGIGIDTIINTGTIQSVDLGAGDDKYTGGANTDKVSDGDGADTILLGAGLDTYTATGAVSDGLDKIDGGTGIDTYRAVVATKVSINLDTVSHTGAAIGSLDPQYTVDKDTAHGTDIGTDTVLNFESVVTGSNDDLVHGSAVANVIQTGAGNDVIMAYGGNDGVDAGSGADLISGGAGHDTLLGGGTDNAVDTFIYVAISDSTVAKTGRDIILDFEDGFDKIDLSGIDANTNSFAPGNQAFSFMGVNVGFGDAGQVSVLTTATGYAIEADVTGDGKADFAIDVADITHSITWTAADFIL